MLPASMTAKPAIAGKPAQTGKIRRLSAAEIAEKRSKNFFFCDQRYLPGHQCPKKFLHSIMTQECDDEEEDHLPIKEDVPLISLYAVNVMENTQISTMRLVGYYKKRKLHMLVDSGSTYNVLDLALAKNLGCKLVPLLTPLLITVANGSKFICSQMCKEFCWEVQGHSFEADFLIMTLGGCDIVLGVQWLSTLGSIKWDLQTLTMQFTLGGKACELQGSNDMAVKVVSNHSLGRMLQQRHIAYLAQITASNADGLNGYVTIDIDNVIEEYKQVFEKITSLPPSRKPRSQDTLG